MWHVPLPRCVLRDTWQDNNATAMRHCLSLCNALHCAAPCVEELQGQTPRLEMQMGHVCVRLALICMIVRVYKTLHMALPLTLRIAYAVVCCSVTAPYSPSQSSLASTVIRFSYPPRPISWPLLSAASCLRRRKEAASRKLPLPLVPQLLLLLMSPCLLPASPVILWASSCRPP